jgi:hypothetical protein
MSSEGSDRDGDGVPARPISKISGAYSLVCRVALVVLVTSESVGCENWPATRIKVAM